MVFRIILGVLVDMTLAWTKCVLLNNTCISRFEIYIVLCGCYSSLSLSADSATRTFYRRSGGTCILVLNAPKMKKKKKKKKENVEFANIVATDEATQNEPPHLNLHCLPSCL